MQSNSGKTGLHRADADDTNPSASISDQKRRTDTLLLVRRHLVSFPALAEVVDALRVGCTVVVSGALHPDDVCKGKHSRDLKRISQLMC